MSDSSDLSPSLTSAAEVYHERTKYDPETLATKARALDWQQQPSPFKTYRLGHPIDLSPYLREPASTADELWWQQLSRLLYCSYGPTAKMSQANLILRAAPSAGGLYPAEVYVVSRGTPQLPAGVYNYQVREIALWPVWQGEGQWRQLQEACFWHPALDETQLALITTAVFFRSAWRYQDRAYRRIYLDTGHLLGNVELAGAIAGYRPHLIGGFIDEAVDRLLYLDSATEGTTAVVALASLSDPRQNLAPTPTVLPSPGGDRKAVAQAEEGELLAAFHQATCIGATDLDRGDATFAYPKKPDLVPWASTLAESVLAPPRPRSRSNATADQYNFPFCLKVPLATPPLDWGDQLRELEQAILRRRSTREYSGEALTLEELKAILDFTYQPQHYLDAELDTAPDYFDLELISTFVAVTNVADLETGCYYYAPAAQEFRQIRFKNFREELHFLCLGQELGRDAGAIVFQTANLAAAVQRWGDRAYRYLHLDSGHLGQRMNLAAVRLDVGVSGIAGFFDNLVNDVLGIPGDEAVLYLTTLGRPWRSPRA